MVSRKGDLIRRVWPIAILLLFCCRFAFADVDVNSLPKPTGYVEDFAHVLSPEEKDELEQFCTRVDQQLGAQFALVTIDTLGDRPIRDFTLDLGRKWGVGAKGTNQGLLLLLAIKDRQNDIEVGRGLEPYVTDGFAGATRRAMTPALQAGQYGPALLGAARTLAGQIAQGKGIPFGEAGVPARTGRKRSEGGQFSWLVIVILFFLFWLIGRGGRRGGRGGGGGVGDFATGVLIGDLLGGGRRGGWGGGNWGGGGFGGNSGGGGGFGGFGGGDFGGGGASGNW